MDEDPLIAWAAGWTNYFVGANCDAEWQTPAEALGKADGTSFDIVCLGEEGRITLTFDTPIKDGPGDDFAVFENAVNDGFLELAYVEVSSDGTNFFRFPNFSMTSNPVPSFGTIDPTDVKGLGCKYRQGYGEPYDLARLEGTEGLDVQDVRWVRVLDVSGDGTFTDSVGRIIYDPYLATGSAGFDLDGVGVLSNEIEEVSIRVVADVAMELGQSNGVLAVSRKSWSTASDLVVNVVVGGTASNGVDYAAITNTVTIEAGSLSQAVVVEPLSDSLPEGDETVVVELAAGASYIVGSAATATVSIADLPIDAWRLESFGEGAGSPDAVDAADWDGDRIRNLMEYALALNPTNHDAGPLFEASFIPTNGTELLAITYARRQDLLDATVIVEVTESLLSGDWRSGPAYLDEFVLGSDGTRVTIRAIVTNSDTDAQGSVRLRVTRP